jgi:hypothetical protein
MLSQMYFAKIFTLEEITINLETKVLQMKSSLLQKKNFPLNLNAVETIIYKQIPDKKTLYYKLVDGTGDLKTHLAKLSNSFKTGIDIVEDKIKIH